MPTQSQGTIGSLDYPPEERKKLAKKSGNFICPDCGSGGSIVDLLKCKTGDSEEGSASTAKEAKEIIKTMALKVRDSTDLMIIWDDFTPSRITSAVIK